MKTADTAHTGNGHPLLPQGLLLVMC